jgi:hypothetical protein
MLQMRICGIACLVACSTLAWAGGDKPPQSNCRESNHGTFWPVEANADPQLLQAKAAAGELWVCHGNYDADFYFPTMVHQFKWKQVTVHYARAGTVANRDPIAQPNSGVRP